MENPIPSMKLEDFTLSNINLTTAIINMPHLQYEKLAQKSGIWLAIISAVLITLLVSLVIDHM